MKREISRRRFLRGSAALGLGALWASTGCTSRCTTGQSCVAANGARSSYVPPVDLAVARGESPADNCLAAVDALGGFSRFIKPGDKVAIKPNPVGERRPEQAIHTHPAMLEAVVRECLRAGAGEVVAVSNDSLRSMDRNGTRAAVENAGGTLKALSDPAQFREVMIPRGRILRRDMFSIDVLEADVFINMPIAKHHGGTRVTFSMKNLMGINWDRIFYHRTNLQQCIAEAASAIKHTLVIMDANNVLLTGGPVGPGRVIHPHRVIAGVDPVAVDAYAMEFFPQKPEEIGHIRMAWELGVGEMDLDKLTIKEIAA